MPLRRQERWIPLLYVSEIYTSVQGESTHAGRMCTFVRLAGCPLRCLWCDTPGSLHRRGAKHMNIEDVVFEVGTMGCSLVEITGGEPLAQKDCWPLVRRLCEKKHEVLIETAGTEPISHLHPKAVIILDVKCPGSKAHVPPLVLARNLDYLVAKDQVKFVLRDRVDYEFARDMVERWTCCARVLFSPVHGVLDPKTLVEWLKEDRLYEVRLNLQQHKYIWGVEATGV